ncbi:hypothetical protein [Streptomyces sp. NPDC058291]|uniref:hypothetical protein n=1 Tax=Streptomyces sp. NPDC058291 TaxID=3346427 RepID=UPI0036E0D950
MEEPATEQADTAAEAGVGPTEDAVAAEAAAEASPEAAEADDAPHAGASKEPVADDDGVDGVGIPRQQSPEETADSEAADDGART